VILIDTGPIVALLRRPDQHHERCVATLRDLREPLATVWPVVTEAMFLLDDRPDVQAALWRSFEAEAIRLVALGRTTSLGSVSSCGGTEATSTCSARGVASSDVGCWPRPPDVV
jgi:predicted nucleic acid-binding protein